jgi:formyl-CoA transferase
MGTFQVGDGSYVALLVANEFIWERFCRAIGREDLIEDPRTENGLVRVQNREFLDPVVHEWMQARTNDQVVQELIKEGVPVGPVQSTEDLVNCPHLKARKMLMEIDDPIAGKRIFAKTPFRMTGVKEPPAKTAPDLGEHTESVLTGWLGYDGETISRLRQDGIV